MKLTELDIQEEDIYIINQKDPLKYYLTPEDTKLSRSVHCVVKYDYIDLGKTDFGFNQEFTPEETKMYFERMRLITTSTIDNLTEKAKELHLYRSEIRGSLKKVISSIYPEMIKANPIIYHISLEDPKSSKEKKERCPRLYFMLGTYGHIYILFFDPYHKLNPVSIS